jgi:hypothetical protein
MNAPTTSAARFAGHRVAGAALVAVECFVAVGAVFGGVGLMADDAIGMLPEWLAGTPFTSWFWPGVFLLLVVATPMIVAAVAEITGRAWAYAASLVAGAAQIGWIVAQWLIFQRYFFLQPIMLAAGLAVLGLAWWVHRGEPIRLPGR